MIQILTIFEMVPGMSRPKYSLLENILLSMWGLKIACAEHKVMHFKPKIVKK